MSNATVPTNVVSLSAAAIKNARAVQATDWNALSLAYNHLDGMPSALIPLATCDLNAPGNGIGSSDTSVSLSIVCWPRYQAAHRVWLFALESVSPGTPTEAVFHDPSGGSSRFTFSDANHLYSHVETIGVRTGLRTTLSVWFECGGDASLLALGCFELPRDTLAVGGSVLSLQDAGMDEVVAASGLPIAMDYAGEGIGFIASEMDQLRDTARRTGIFFSAPQISTSSASFDIVFQSPPIGLGRYLYNGQTRTMMRVATTGTGNGEVRITMASGAVVRVPLNVETQIAIDCEDLTDADGRRSSRDDTITVEFRAVSGTAVLNTISGGEGFAGSPPTSIPVSVLRVPKFTDRGLPHWKRKRKRIR